MTWTTCCCCFKLRFGTLTIGVLMLINHGLEALGAVVGIIKAGQKTTSDPYTTDSLQKVLLAASIGALVVSEIWFIMDILLLRGVVQDRPVFVLAWLCWGIPIAGLTIAASCVLVYGAVQQDHPGYIAASCVLLVNYVVLAYWAAVVFVYYRAMKATARVGTVARTVHHEPSPILGYRQSAAMILNHQLPVTAMQIQQPRRSRTWMERSSMQRERASITPMPSQQPRPSMQPRPSQQVEHPLDNIQEASSSTERY